MNRTKDQARGYRTFRLERLETRTLLSHVPSFRVLVPSPHPALPPASVIKGSLNLIRASDGLYTSTPPGRISYSGNGMASPANVGNLTFGLQQTETPQAGAAVSTVNITRGNAILADRFGEQVQIVYTGQETFPRHKAHPITLTGTIRSGNGRFINATGTFSATGHVVSADTIALKFVLKPVYKTS